jgi:DNA-binding transcriptional ArsR family regulator
MSGDKPDTEQAAELLRALAHPVRLTILNSLRECERAVSEIEAITGVGQPGLSQQLAVLRKANLVRTRREAKQIHYRIDAEAIAAARAILDGLVRPATPEGSLQTPRESGPASAGSARASRASGVAVFARINR